MSDNPNEITIDNSALILIDHQPWVAFSVKSIDAGLLANNLVGLASSAKALDVPTILTTVGAEGGPLVDPSMRALADVFSDVTPIDRVSTNAWEDIREAVEATGRRTLLMPGCGRRSASPRPQSQRWPRATGCSSSATARAV